MLYNLPKLQFLDSRRVLGKEVVEAKRRGKLMKVVRPKQNEQEIDSRDTPVTYPYTPLPKSVRKPNDLRGKDVPLICNEVLH